MEYINLRKGEWTWRCNPASVDIFEYDDRFEAVMHFGNRGNTVVSETLEGVQETAKHVISEWTQEFIKRAGLEVRT